MAKININALIMFAGIARNYGAEFDIKTHVKLILCKTKNYDGYLMAEEIVRQMGPRIFEEAKNGNDKS